jgi:hypothetical protein
MLVDIDGDGSMDVVDGRGDGDVDVYLGGKNGLSSDATAILWTNPLGTAEAIAIEATNNHPNDRFGESTGSALWHETDFNIGWVNSACNTPGACLGYAKALTRAPGDVLK